jgi:hypothetical protein
MNLRKAAHSIELSQSDLNREMDVTEKGIYHLYTRAAISRTEVNSGLSEVIEDSGFLERAGDRRSQNVE